MQFSLIVVRQRQWFLTGWYTYPLGVPNTATGGTKNQHF